MPLPLTIDDLSTTAALNYPSGADQPSVLDDTQRAHAAFIAQLRDDKIELTDLAPSTVAAQIGRIDSAAGAVAQTVEDMLRKWVHISSFNPPTDGTSDSLTALTAFYNSANSRPGVRHVIDNATYCISAPLPETNVSNVKIYGSGCARHDVGAVITGTRIKAIGSVASWTGDVMRTVQPVSGVSAQHLSNHAEVGICYDANDIAEKAFVANSCFKSTFTLGAIEARNTAVTFGAVAGGGGEAFDTQLCDITLELNQTLTTAANGYGARFGGNAIANFSLNNVKVNGVHSNLALIRTDGTDNNDWWIRSFCVGSATENVSMVGGATDAESTRNERIQFISGNVGLHVYGTALTTFPARDIYIFALDTGNGTPEPTIEVGAIGKVHWRKNQDTAFGDSPWVSSTPTVTAASGTITTSSCTMRKLTRGRRIYIDILISITTNGTGSSGIIVPLGFTSASAGAWTLVGKEYSLTGRAVTGFVLPSATDMLVQFYDGTYPGANGANIAISGFVEIA